MKRFFYFTLSILLFMLGISLGGNIESFSFADETPTYTSVIEDLSKDKSFDISSYPHIDNNYSLQIIQIAESSNKELFVYVYQPCGLEATSINFSTAINESFFPKLYNLILLDKQDTLAKYVVKDFEVKADVVRYYDIVSIFRSWNENFDDPPLEGQTISEVSYEVAKQWTACTLNGQVSYNFLDTQTIEITQKFVGFVRYVGGINTIFGWGTNESCDSHFVAFNTDLPIDKLYEADVYYTSQPYTFHHRFPPYADGENFGKTISENIVTLNYTEKVEYTGSGIRAPTYSWNRIQNFNDFKKSVNQVDVFTGAIINTTVSSKMTSDAINALKDKQWFLRFVETPYNVVSTGHEMRYESTLVGDVSILRLKFKTDGKTYNLGVVDNKQTGSKDPINETKRKNSLNWLVWLIIAIVLIVLLFPLLWPFLQLILSKIFKLIWVAIKFILKCVWWVLKRLLLFIKLIFTLPFETFGGE